MFSRTLNGANMVDATSLNLPDNVNAIRINGDFGTAGQVIAKDSNNRLNWSRVDEVEIPDNSIGGNKLKTDITFSTTSLIRANEFFSNYFIVGQFGAQNVVLDDDGLIIVGSRRIEASNSFMNINNITIKGGGGVSPALDIEAGGIDFEGDITSVNGGITLTNGDVVLTNGTLFANVEGTITEEIVECNRLIIRNATPPIASPILEIQDAISFRMLNSSAIQIFNIDGSTGNISIAGNISTSGNYNSTTGNITLTNGTLTLTNGLLTTNDITMGGSLTSATGNITLSGGNLSVGGQSTLTGNCLFIGDLSSSAGDIILINGDITLTNGNLSVGGTTTFTGNMSSTSGNITLTNGLLTANNISFTTALNSLNGDITLTNGDLSCNDITSNDITCNDLTCNDITITNHTGFTDVRADNIELPRTGTILIDLEGSTGDITTAGNITMSSIGKDFTLKGDISMGGNLTSLTGNITLTGGLLTANNISFTTSLTSATGNLTLTGGNLSIGGTTTFTGNMSSTSGDISLTNGNLLLNNGLLTTQNIDMVGNLVSSNGDITLSNGDLYVGGTTTLSGNSDFVGDLTSTNGNVVMTNGNLTLTNGTIFANVDGTITEELVDCQRLSIRNGGVAGSTNIFLDTGAFLYNNKASTTQELLLDADTGNIVGNQLTAKGNTQLGYNSSTTTTIGRFGISNQALDIQCQTINIGSSSGAQSTNNLTYRGGLHTFTGEKVVFGQYLGYTLLSCNIEGRNHQYLNEYTNRQKYFHLDGENNTHTLKGTTQEYSILRASTERAIPVVFSSGFSNSSTTYTNITNFNLTSKARSTTCRIHFEHFVHNLTGSPDIYCRIDSSSTGANAYPSQIGGPVLVLYTGFMGVNNRRRIVYSITISGLFPETNYSFYPKYAKKQTSTNIMNFVYGGENGDAIINIEWLDGETDKGSISDPYAPSGGDDY